MKKARLSIIWMEWGPNLLHRPLQRLGDKCWERQDWNNWMNEGKSLKNNYGQHLPKVMSPSRLFLEDPVPIISSSDLFSINYKVNYKVYTHRPNIELLKNLKLNYLILHKIPSAKIRIQMPMLIFTVVLFLDCR